MTLGAPRRRRTLPTVEGAALWVVALLVGAASAVLTSVSPVLVVGSAVLVGLFVSLLALPDFATLLVVTFLYSNAAVVMVKVHGLPSLAAQAPFVLLLLPLVHHVVVRREPLVWPRASSWCAAYGTVYLLSALFSPTASATVPFLITFGTEGLGLYFILTNVVRSSRQLELAVRCLTGAAGFLGAVTLAQHVRQSYWTSFYGFAQVGDHYIPGATDWTGWADGTVGDGSPRLAGPIGEANFFALILIMALPYAVHYASSATRGWERACWALCVVFIASGAVFTYSRGAVVAVVVAVVGLSVTGVIPRSSLVATALCGLAAVVLVPSYASRLGEIQSALHLGGGSSVGTQDASAQGRFSEVTAALDVYRDHPLLGVGPGQFPSYYQDYSGDESGGVHTGEGGRNAHNLIAGTAAETGTAGLLTFFGIFGAVLRGLWLLRRTAAARSLATAALASLCIGLCASMFLHLAYLRFMFLHLALTAAMPSLLQGRTASVQSVGSGLRTAPVRART